MSSSDQNATLKACNKVMQGALKLVLESSDPNNVDFAGLTKVKNQKCTGFYMLFFTVDSVTGQSGTLQQCGGILPPKTKLMLLQYYPHLLAKLYGLAEVGGVKSEL